MQLWQFYHSYAAHVSEQPAYLRNVKDKLRCAWFAGDGWRCILTFLASGSGLLTPPIDVQSLSAADRELFVKVWTQFSRLFASAPEDGERNLQEEVQNA